MFAPPEVSDIHYTTLLGEDTISALCFSHTRAVECADFGCKNQGKGQPLRQIQKNLGQNFKPVPSFSIGANQSDREHLVSNARVGILIFYCLLRYCDDTISTVYTRVCTCIFYTHTNTHSIHHAQFTPFTRNICTLHTCTHTTYSICICSSTTLGA